MLFQDAFCSLCHGRMWVDLFLQVCTWESASDLQIAFIIRHIVHWWIMCGLQRRYAAFKIARLFCKPQPQRQAGPSEVASGSRGFLRLFPRFLRSLVLPSGSSCVSLTGWGLETRSQSQLMEKTWDGERILKSLLRKLMLLCLSHWQFPWSCGLRQREIPDVVLCTDVLPVGIRRWPQPLILISLNWPTEACAEVLGLEKPVESSESVKFHWRERAWEQSLNVTTRKGSG